jgi:sugar lactone lactonase YvrE
VDWHLQRRTFRLARSASRLAAPTATRPRVAAIVGDRAGRLMVATHDGAFSRFDGRIFTPIRLPPPMGPATGYSGEIWQQMVLQARSGDWWLRTPAGAFHLRDAHGEPSSIVEDFGRGGALASRVIERLYEDRRGHVWIATRPQAGSSLAEWDPSGGLHVFDARDGLPATGHPTAFAEDRYGALWIGFSDSCCLARRDGERFQFWTKGAGAPAGEIRAVFRDRRDHLWVAADVGGLRLVTGEDSDRPRFDPWTTAQGLSSNNTRALADDDSGRVYVGTELGVDRIDPATRIVRHYTTADGLASNEVDVASTSRDGSVWFGTYSGLSRLVPERDRADTPPPIWIYSVRVADTPAPVDALGATRLSLAPIEPGDNRVAVEFGSLEFGAHGAVRYEYRLDGVDRDWQRARDEHRVTYARLGAGQYRFQVRAVTEAGVASRSRRSSTSPCVLRCGCAAGSWPRRHDDRVCGLRAAPSASRACWRSSACGSASPSTCTTTSAPACRESRFSARSCGGRRPAADRTSTGRSRASRPRHVKLSMP